MLGNVTESVEKNKVHTGQDAFGKGVRNEKLPADMRTYKKLQYTLPCVQANRLPSGRQSEKDFRCLSDGWICAKYKLQLFLLKNLRKIRR